MLPKSERLTKKDFMGIRPQTVFRGTYFDIAIIKNNTKKFGCVVAKKRVKRAVDRNRIKRKVYTGIRIVKPNTHNSFVIYPKQAALSSKSEGIFLELRTAFATLQ